MSENGVHEDVVDEIDRYIGRLRDTNVSRQEEVTGDLIPKYKAVLKIAREYTKGSDVDPHELANTISEMMWAAHDGNLDTKQFVSTVRLFAEDILRTGRKINDDKYQELTEDEILEEIAAQYFGVVFSLEENIRKAVNEANDAEKSILKKIIGRLKQFIAHIKGTLREYAVKDKTVEAALNAEIKDLEELARKFDAALAESGKNKNPATDEGGVKYSKKRRKYILKCLN